MNQVYVLSGLFLLVIIGVVVFLVSRNWKTTDEDEEESVKAHVMLGTAVAAVASAKAKKDSLELSNKTACYNSCKLKHVHHKHRIHHCERQCDKEYPIPWPKS